MVECVGVNFWTLCLVLYE